MSRIGKKPVQIPAGVTVTVDNTTVTVKGSKGELTRTFSELVAIAQEGEEILVTRVDESAPLSTTWLLASLRASRRSLSSPALVIV